MELLDLASWVLLVAGAVFCVIGGIGLLRMPDFYARTHAASITDTLGAGLMLAGLSLQAGGDWLVVSKLVFVGIFLFITSPTIAHALAKAAYAEGVEFQLEPGGAVRSDADGEVEPE